MPQRSTKNGFFTWLGRQVGHVKKAVKTPAGDLTRQVVYRQGKVEEKQMPNQPGIVLRRTTIDEVLVEEKSGESKDTPAKPSPRERKT